MERLHNIIGHPHELIVRGGWRCALRHRVVNGLCDAAETEQEHCRGAPGEVFWGEGLSPGKLCHDVGEREGEVA